MTGECYDSATTQERGVNQDYRTLKAIESQISKHFDDQILNLFIIYFIIQGSNIKGIIEYRN